MEGTDVTTVESLTEFRRELLPARLQEIWDKTPDYLWDLSEYELRTETRQATGIMRKDFSILSKIRIAFWEEYERAARVPEPLKGNGLWRSVCRADQYYPFFAKYKSLLPWVVCPLSGYLMQRKELEFLAEERMIEILSVSPVKEDGKVDSRLAKVQVEIYQTIQDRVYGPVIQKIQTEGKNVNVNVNSDQTTEEARRTIGLITNVEEIDRRIQALREKSIALKTISHQPIEVNTQKLMRPDLVNTHNNEDQE